MMMMMSIVDINTNFSITKFVIEYITQSIEIIKLFLYFVFYNEIDQQINYQTI